MTALSLSTSWNSFRHTSGHDLIDEIVSIGFGTVELNFALTEAMVRDILAEREAGRIRVSSLHNMCPLPSEIDPAHASPDYYSLSSSDEKVRRLAVAAAKETVRWAGRLGAAAVVLHAGRVEIKDRTRRLAELTGDPDAFGRLREEMVRERRANEGVSVDNAIRSLEDLVPFAREHSVAIGIENRYYYREIPVFHEFQKIFRHFKPGEVCYWHDVGHAEVFERLGLVRHKDLLEAFSGRLLGIHLHDIIGPVQDHKAPGCGTFDFQILKPYLKPDTITVMEVHHPASAQEVKAGAAHCVKALG